MKHCKCTKCSYEWNSRKEEPKQCPICHKFHTMTLAGYNNKDWSCAEYYCSECKIVIIIRDAKQDEINFFEGEQ